MEIKTETVESVSVVSLNGRLDAGTSGDLEKELVSLIQAKASKVLVDCRELEYISSAGLRVLLAAAKQFKKEGGKITLCSLTPNVKQVFEISGFTSIFSLYGTREEAIKAFA